MRRIVLSASDLYNYFVLIIPIIFMVYSLHLVVNPIHIFKSLKLNLVFALFIL